MLFLSSVEIESDAAVTMGRAETGGNRLSFHLPDALLRPVSLINVSMARSGNIATVTIVITLQQQVLLV